MHVTVVIHVELVPTLVFGAIRMHIAAAKSAAGRPSLRQLATVQPKLDFTSAQLVSTRVRHQLPTQKLNAPYPPPAQTDGPSAPQSEPAASIATTHHTRLTVPMTTVWAMGGSVVKPAMRHNISLMRQGYIEYYDPKPGTSISTLAYEYAPAFRVPELLADSSAIRHLDSRADHAPHLHARRSFDAYALSAAQPRPQAARYVHGAARDSAGARADRRSGPHRTAPHAQSLALRATGSDSLPPRRRIFRSHIPHAAQRSACALRDLIVFHLEGASSVPTFLTLPKDPRALAVAQALIANQAHNPSLDSLCASAGASVRTIERVFRSEVGTDFATWRRQARLM